MNKTKRTKKREKQKRKRQEFQERVRKFPPFVFKEKNADPGFVKIIKEACSNLRFDKMPHDIQRFMKSIKAKGTNHVLNDIKLEHGEIASLQAYNIVGQMVYKIASELDDNFRRFIPYSDFSAHPEGRKIVVRILSLRSASTKWGKIHYSLYKPKIRVAGKDRIIAYSNHAISRICERLSVDWDNYAGAGDAFCYLNNYIYGDLCMLTDNKTLAFKIWNVASQGRHSWYDKCACHILDVEKTPKNTYILMGYCPCSISGDYLVAKSLLVPGYRQTPERVWLEENRSRQEAQKIVDEIEENLSVRMKAFKLFHDNELEQVKEIKEKVFVRKYTLHISTEDYKEEMEKNRELREKRLSSKHSQDRR